MSVLITIPHARCLSFIHPDRHCDPSVRTFADQLNKALEERQITSRILEGKINRTRIDLNRAESFSQDFHIELNHLLDARTPRVVIDLHSGRFRHLKTPFVLLNMLHKGDNELIRFLSDRINATVYAGARENYIVMKCLRFGTPAALVECNTIAPPNKEDFNTLASAIRDYLRER